MRYNKSLFIFTAAALSLLSTGCDLMQSDSPKDPAVETVTIHGAASFGRVVGAEIAARGLDGSLLAGPVSTTTDGGYSLSLAKSALSGDFILEATGGTVTDEATGDSQVPSGKLVAYVAAGSLDTALGIQLTPASTMLGALRIAGKSASTADSVFKLGFGFSPSLVVRPVDIAAGSQASSPEERRLAALRAAAFSQLAKDLGLTPSKKFELLQALARDLADGRLDGKDTAGNSIDLPAGGKLPVDIQNRFERALLRFWTAKKDNLALTADKIGILPFGKVALTDMYRVEYVAGMMSAMPGRTQFKIKVSDRTTGNPVTGLTLKLMPNMVMASHEHSTPIGGVTDNGDGTYSCEVYYLMASVMSTGSMGYWELKVTAGSDTSSALFYPLVNMSMGGDAVRANLKGVADKISNMGTTASRTYMIFNNGLTGTAGNHGFAMFIATMESMMAYPAVFTGVSLKNEAAAAWTVTGMAVSVSTDGTTWVNATSAGNGKWSASGLTGLTQGTAGTIRVKLVVNGEQKTTDGLALSGDGVNGSATFSVTPKQ